MSTNETVIITETSDEQSTTVTEVIVAHVENGADGASETPESLNDVIEAILDENPDATVYAAEEYIVEENSAVDFGVVDDGSVQQGDSTILSEETDSTAIIDEETPDDGTTLQAEVDGADLVQPDTESTTAMAPESASDGSDFAGNYQDVSSLGSEPELAANETAVPDSID